MRIYMQTRPSPDKVPRFYHLHLEPDLFEGWMLTKESGIQGARGKLKMTYFSDVQEAETEFQKLRDAQVKRGYKVVFVEGLSSPG